MSGGRRKSGRTTGGGVEPSDTDQTADLGTQGGTLAFISTAPLPVGTQDEELGYAGTLEVAAGTDDGGLGVAGDGALTDDLGGADQAGPGDLMATLSTTLGAPASSLADPIGALIVAVGGDGAEASVGSLLGTLTEAAGTQGESFATDTDGTATTSVGTEDAAHAADSTATTTSHPTSHTVTQGWNGAVGDNSNNWANITNAYDEALGDATISASAGALNPNGFEDRIEFADFELDGAAPTGWTRSLVEVKVAYGYDLTFTHLAGHDRITIQVRKADGTNVQTLRDSTNVNATRGMQTDTFDITAAFNALTDGEREGVKLWFGVDAHIPPGGGNASVTLDFVRIETTLARTGIS